MKIGIVKIYCCREREYIMYTIDNLLKEDEIKELQKYSEVRDLDDIYIENIVFYRKYFTKNDYKTINEQEYDKCDYQFCRIEC